MLQEDNSRDRIALLMKQRNVEKPLLHEANSVMSMTQRHMDDYTLQDSKNIVRLLQDTDHAHLNGLPLGLLRRLSFLTSFQQIAKTSTVVSPKDPASKILILINGTVCAGPQKESIMFLRELGSLLKEEEDEKKKEEKQKKEQKALQTANEETMSSSKAETQSQSQSALDSKLGDKERSKDHSTSSHPASPTISSLLSARKSTPAQGTTGAMALTRIAELAELAPTNLSAVNKQQPLQPNNSDNSQLSGDVSERGSVSLSQPPTPANNPDNASEAASPSLSLSVVPRNHSTASDTEPHLHQDHQNDVLSLDQESERDETYQELDITNNQFRKRIKAFRAQMATAAVLNPEGDDEASAASFHSIHPEAVAEVKEFEDQER